MREIKQARSLPSAALISTRKNPSVKPTFSRLSPHRARALPGREDFQAHKAQMDQGFLVEHCCNHLDGIGGFNPSS
jgi:hypothetical protein